MITVGIRGVGDTLKMLAAYQSRAGSETYVRAAATGEVSAAVEENFRRLNASRNRHGSNFYLHEGVRKTQPYPDKGMVVVASRLIEHKLKGGIIRPRNAQSLAIPVSALARGKTPRGGQIPGLRLIASRRSGKAMLGTVGADGRIEAIHYVLVKSVAQRARPETLPSKTAFARALQTVCEDLAAKPYGERI